MNDLPTETPVETKVCSTCKQPIDVSKFRIHEIGCARNNYICNICGDLVAKAEREEHESQAHTKVVCQFCRIEFEKRQIEGHESGCFAKPKECKYCEQVIKFDDYERHVSFCGSKTKKCQDCGRNVCLKDEDSHQYGGECSAFKEEDLRMRLEKAQREEEEKKRREIESKRKQELDARKRLDMEKKFEDNFNMEDVDNERGNNLQDKLPRTNTVKAGKQQLTGAAPQRQTNLNSFMNPGTSSSGVSQQMRTGQQIALGGQSSNIGAPKQLQPRITSTGNSSKLPSQQITAQQQQQSSQQRQMPSSLGGKGPASNPSQIKSTVTGTSSMNRPGTKGAVSNTSQNTRLEEQKQSLAQNRPGVITGTSSKPKGGVVINNLRQGVGIPKNNGPIVNPRLTSNTQSNQISQPRPQVRTNPQPQKQTSLHQNQQPLAQHNLDPNEELLARMLEEDEDMRIANEIQNNIYTGGSGTGKTSKPQQNAASTQNRPQNQRAYQEDHPMHQEQLIGDARSNFRDEWGMDPSEVAQHYGGAGAGAGYDDQMMDDEYQKVIEESLRSQKGARDIEEEQLRRAIEESAKQFGGGYYQ